MSQRIKRKKTTSVTQLSNNYILKLRLIPWLYSDDGVIWLASMAVGKSTRQINDWMARRKNKRVRQMDSSLTGKEANRTQAIAIRQVREWIKSIPPGDSLTLRCESAVPARQFRVWKKWFEKHEKEKWKISEYFQSFFYYKEREYNRESSIKDNA